ncbi:MAG: hypothetical protein K8R90_07610 [Candidatus Cloacimonetes bacterium]|nr:hypothetical protein [Candidatus Cloacimonadota bacterium]
MQVKLNDKTLDIKASSVTSLKQILDEIERHVPDSAIITEVTLNGKQLEDNWMQKMDGIYVMEDDSLELKTRSAIELGREAFLRSQEQFRAIREDFEKIAEMFRLDDEVKANSYLAQAVDNLQAYFRIIQESLILMNRSFADFTIDGNTAPQFMDSFSDKLSELIDIQKNKDWVLLADMIEYELLPLLQKVDSIYPQS